MRFTNEGGLRRLGLVVCAGVVAALAVAGATSAHVEAGSSGSTTAALTTNDKVTLCHAAGQDGTTKFVTLTISYNAAFGQAGHFYEDGTPRAGHEDDYLGPCNPPPPTDVCPNIDGVQHSVPDGMVKDEHGNCVTPPSPPPPPPPTVTTDEFMDVQVDKDATAQVQLVNGQADVAYTVRVRNNGPNQAHNVMLADSAPTGVTFLAVTQQPVGGNCTVTPALLSCTLGTLGPGVERTIGFSARVTQTGTYQNCATGTGSGKDTNGANNTDCASTLVTAPVTPPTTTPTTPTPKPKPKPEPDICRVLKVTPGMVKANGKRHVVLAKVTRSKTPVKGVAVRFAGTGLNKVVKTNAQGVARLGVTPSTAGIMLVRITSVKACNSARIGVVGVFEPPVTG